MIIGAQPSRLSAHTLLHGDGTEDFVIDWMDTADVIKWLPAGKFIQGKKRLTALRYALLRHAQSVVKDMIFIRLIYFMKAILRKLKTIYQYMMLTCTMITCHVLTLLRLCYAGLCYAFLTGPTSVPCNPSDPQRNGVRSKE